MIMGATVVQYIIFQSVINPYKLTYDRKSEKVLLNLKME